MITNVHTRRLPVRACEVRRLLDTLGSAGDQVWPTEQWPAMTLRGGLVPGSYGGHASIRYVVDSVSDREITFRFVKPDGINGVHRFEVRPNGLACQIRHTIEIRPTLRTRLAWYAAIRPLHDALLEDLLDKISVAVGVPVERPARWSARVRRLRERFAVTAEAHETRQRPVPHRTIGAARLAA